MVRIEALDDRGSSTLIADTALNRIADTLARHILRTVHVFLTGSVGTTLVVRGVVYIVNSCLRQNEPLIRWALQTISNPKHANKQTISAAIPVRAPANAATQRLRSALSFTVHLLFRTSKSILRVLRILFQWTRHLVMKYIIEPVAQSKKADTEYQQRNASDDDHAAAISTASSTTASNDQHQSESDHSKPSTSTTAATATAKATKKKHVHLVVDDDDDHDHDHDDDDHYHYHYHDAQQRATTSAAPPSSSSSSSSWSSSSFVFDLRAPSVFSTALWGGIVSLGLYIASHPFQARYSNRPQLTYYYYNSSGGGAPPPNA